MGVAQVLALTVMLCGSLFCTGAAASKIPLEVQIYPTVVRAQGEGSTVGFRIEGADLLVEAVLLAHGTPPQSVRAAPDALGESDTALTVYLDVTGQGKYALLFAVNPEGSVVDGNYQEEVNHDGHPFGNTGADYRWSVQTQVQAQSWSAQMRIPLRELGLVPGLTPKVYVEYKAVNDTVRVLASGDPQTQGGCKLCVAQPLPELVGLSVPRQTWRLEPGVYAQAQASKDDATSSTLQDQKASLNVAWQADKALEVRATFNPNFVERAPDQPVLGYAEQFTPEREETRQFFARATDLLQSPGLKLINTRAIGIPSAAGAAQLETGQWRGLALMSEEEAGGLLLLPGTFSNRFVTLGQTRSSIFKGIQALAQGELAWTAVDRQYKGIGATQMFAAHASQRWDGGNSLFGQLAKSQTNTCDQAATLVACAPRSGQAGYLRFNHASAQSGWSAEHFSLDDDFRADVGWVNQVGIRKWRFDAFRQWDHPVDGVESLRVAPFVSNRDEQTGKPRSTFAGTDLTIVAANGTEWWVTLMPVANGRLDELAQAVNQRQLWVGVSAYPGGLVSAVQVNLGLGELADFYHALPGTGFNASANATLSLGKSIRVQAFAQIFSSRADAGFAYSGPSYQASAVQISANWQYQTFSRWRYVVTQSAEQVLDFSSLQAQFSRQWAHSLLWEEAPRQGWGRAFSLTSAQNVETGLNVLSAVAQIKYSL